MLLFRSGGARPSTFITNRWRLKGFESSWWSRRKRRKWWKIGRQKNEVEMFIVKLVRISLAIYIYIIIINNLAIYIYMYKYALICLFSRLRSLSVVSVVQSTIHTLLWHRSYHLMSCWYPAKQVFLFLLDKWQAHLALRLCAARLAAFVFGGVFLLKKKRSPLLLNAGYHLSYPLVI